MRRILQILHSIEYWRIRHVLREDNRVLDSLTKMISDKDHNVQVFEERPIFDFLGGILDPVSRMAEIDHCCSTQLIDGEGEFNVVGLDNFIRTTKLTNCGLSYAVVAIMGPQSSGASRF
ncbi:hypothetical protein Goklo_006717, partial [Gossypium klotzschianum]|nr:hypothetical protein [Gossypium klotzschianum]